MEGKVMNLKRLDPYDREIELGAQRFLLGRKAAGQPIKIDQDQKASNDSLKQAEGTLSTDNFKKSSSLPKVSCEKKGEKPEVQSQKSFDGLLSLAYSLDKTKRMVRTGKSEQKPPLPEKPFENLLSLARSILE
jgi:hypothetical protein